MGKLITHDLNGNLAGDGNNFYIHDAINRLITATVDSTPWTYTYGPLDRRVAKTDGTTTTKYLYDNARAVAEYSSSGTLLRKYIYGPGLDEPIMMVVPGDDTETVYYYHADHLGSVIGITNDTGAWTEKYAYTLYGKPAAPSSIGNPYMYTGRRFDPETELYYYRARYYDSQLRRFIQPDPISYTGGMNLYRYVLNNPVNMVDLFGLIWVTVDVEYMNHSQYNTVRGLFNAIVAWIGRGGDRQLPWATKGEWVGIKRDLIQEWRADPNNSCKDSQYPLGTRRRLPQEIRKYINPGPGKALTNDPNSFFYYQWDPWVDSPTYENYDNQKYDNLYYWEQAE